MKLTIGAFEVDIKAKGITDSAKYNKEDLELFLMGLQETFLNAMNFVIGNGMMETATEYRDCTGAIDRALEEIRN